ncbi:hypothetical protein Plhal703r1_c77g0173071 [Plasmopara halstedii]
MSFNTTIKLRLRRVAQLLMVVILASFETTIDAVLTSISSETQNSRISLEDLKLLVSQALGNHKEYQITWRAASLSNNKNSRSLLVKVQQLITEIDLYNKAQEMITIETLNSLSSRVKLLENEISHFHITSKARLPRACSKTVVPVWCSTN